MSEHEAIVFRFLNHKKRIYYVTALLLLVAANFAAMIALLPAVESGWLFGFGLLLAFCGILIYGFGKAMWNQGYWRSAFKTVGLTFNDPPLEEWAKSLDERNAFIVDGDSE